MAALTPGPGSPSGWYQDPDDPAFRRFYDARRQEWTASRKPAGKLAEAAWQQKVEEYASSPGAHQIVCPHCQARGTVRAKRRRVKRGGVWWESGWGCAHFGAVCACYRVVAEGERDGDAVRELRHGLDCLKRKEAAPQARDHLALRGVAFVITCWWSGPICGAARTGPGAGHGVNRRRSP